MRSIVILAFSESQKIQKSRRYSYRLSRKEVERMEPWDVVIIGGGILGTSVSYWLGNQYEGRIAVLEKEEDVAMHTSRRNTGVVHRPFYLDPVKRRIFARCSQAAYGMWKSYAQKRGLPWKPVTTLEVATRPEDVKRVEKYYHWGVQNGMGEDELEVLTSEEVRKLEPHVRADGRREIGPNAVPVAGPYTYRGFFRNPSDAVKKIFEQPIANKIALLYNRDFIELAGQEWLSSISKGEMARRAQEFIPELKVKYLTKPGIAGVRAQVIDRKGNFIKEAIELHGSRSYHITNYNSPGATGSPAFAAWLVNRLGLGGHLEHLKGASGKEGPWDFQQVNEQINLEPSTDVFPGFG